MSQQSKKIWNVSKRLLNPSNLSCLQIIGPFIKAFVLILYEHLNIKLNSKATSFIIDNL